MATFENDFILAYNDTIVMGLESTRDLQTITEYKKRDVQKKKFGTLLGSPFMLVL